jgi:paraquat-inducible protein A
MTRQLPLTAVAASLVGCHICGLVVHMPRDAHRVHLVCPRCGATLHRRKPDSLGRTWALVIAACLLYIPANVLPITLTTTFGSTQSDTILSGVVYLMAHGMWPVALLIFFASIIVPMMKLIILIYLLTSVARKSQWRPGDRTRLYRITEAVGRWSMVDIYVVTILVALVNLGELATIKAGPGAIAFGGVVVITMFAAMTFDPRLIWDAMENRE